MSWDSYIDNLIAQTKDPSGSAHADKACIIGIDGGAKWTTDGHPCALKLSPWEAGRISACFKQKDFTAFATDGIMAEGTRYLFLREDDGKIAIGRKKDSGSITLQSSKTAIVIGHTAEGMQQGNVNKGVGVIADYLESMGM